MFMVVLTACLVCGIFLQFLLLLKFLVKERRILAEEYGLVDTESYKAAIALKDHYKVEIKRVIGWRELSLAEFWAWDTAMQEVVAELRDRLRKL